MSKLYIAKVADEPNEWVVGDLVGENLILQIEPCSFSKACGMGTFSINPKTLLVIDEETLSYLNELKDKMQVINDKKQETLNEILLKELEKVEKELKDEIAKNKICSEIIERLDEQLEQITNQRNKAIEFIKYLDYNYSSYMTEDEKFSEWRKI